MVQTHRITETNCPEPRTLARFAHGELPDELLETIEDHISTCEICLGQLGRMQALAEESCDARLREILAQPLAAPRLSGTLPVDLAAPDTRLSWSFHHIGNRIGPYEVIELLGTGGMGVVYRAEQGHFKQQVALKTLSQHTAHQPDRVARFRNEGSALSRLLHPNIVRLLHFDEFEGSPYFTMELVAGGSLANRLDRGPLDFATTARVVSAVSRAVAYAHSQHVVHRDLKPQNVLLEADGTPKVSDFGLARILDEDATHTATGMTVGTPSFMAPEQAGATGDRLGPAVDIYAIGAVLYSCLTSQPPFRGPDALSILRKVLTEQPVRPKSLRPDVPADLEAIALRCLEKNPRHRYQSAAEVADELDRWQAGERTVAGRQARSRRVKAWIRRNARTATVILGVGAVVAGVGAGAASWNSSPAISAAGSHLPDNQGDDATIQAQQRELAERRPLPLVGDSGQPRWYRRLVSRSSGKIVLSDDRLFTVTASKPTLIELVPDSLSGSYRLTAQVRHSRSDRGGRVGIYVARTEHPVPDHPPIHTFCHLSYNDVRKPLDKPIQLSVDRNGQQKREGIDPDDVPELSFIHLSDPDVPPDVSSNSGWSAGPAHPPLGEESGTWRKLELVVQPDRVTASWDGQPPRTITSEEITTRIQGVFEPVRKHQLFANFPAIQAFQPRYIPRGGCGLFVARATASFKNVVFTLVPSE